MRLHLLDASVRRVVPSGRRGRQCIQQMLRHVRTERAARNTACRLMKSHVSMTWHGLAKPQGRHHSQGANPRG